MTCKFAHTPARPVKGDPCNRGSNGLTQPARSADPDWPAFTRGTHTDDVLESDGSMTLRWFMLGLALVLCSLLAACSGEDATRSVAPTANKPTTPSKSATTLPAAGAALIAPAGGGFRASPWTADVTDAPVNELSNAQITGLTRRLANSMAATQLSPSISMACHGCRSAGTSLERRFAGTTAKTRATPLLDCTALPANSRMFPFPTTPRQPKARIRS